MSGDDDDFLAWMDQEGPKVAAEAGGTFVKVEPEPDEPEEEERDIFAPADDEVPPRPQGPVSADTPVQLVDGDDPNSVRRDGDLFEGGEDWAFKD